MWSLIYHISRHLQGDKCVSRKLVGSAWLASFNSKKLELMSFWKSQARAAPTEYTIKDDKERKRQKSFMQHAWKENGTEESRKAIMVEFNSRLGPLVRTHWRKGFFLFRRMSLHQLMSVLVHIGRFWQVFYIMNKVWTLLFLSGIPPWPAGFFGSLHTTNFTTQFRWAYQ